MAALQASDCVWLFYEFWIAFYWYFLPIERSTLCSLTVLTYPWVSNLRDDKDSFSDLLLHNLIVINLVYVAFFVDPCNQLLERSRMMYFTCLLPDIFISLHILLQYVANYENLSKRQCYIIFKKSIMKARNLPMNIMVSNLTPSFI